jgi:hemerythrin
MADILGAMTNSFGHHFDTEEQMMIDLGYPEIESHREAHQRFVFHTAYFMATYRESGATIKNEILSFLRAWLVDHIVKNDGDLGRFIKAARSD